MAIWNKGAIALGLATLVAGATGFTVWNSQPDARPAGAVESAAVMRAVTLGANAAPVAAVAPALAQPATVSPEQPVPDDAQVIERILPITGPIKYGEWHWDDKDVPAGKIRITVDLEARVMSVWRGGYEIGAAAVLLGSPEKPTPTGVFPIMGKARHHISNLYNAPMPYMQRLTNDGIALHSTTVERFYASHGCVGMPDEFARLVFQTTKVGDLVIITKGKMVGKGDALAVK